MSASDELQPWRERLAFVHRVREVIRRCHHQLRTSGDALPRLADRLLDWHDFFCQLNAVAPHAGMSLTDMAFLATCLTHFCEDVNIRAGITVNSIAEAYASLVVVSCQHTLDSRDYWPSAAEWARLRALVSGVVAVFFDAGEKTRSELVARIASDNFRFEDMPESLRFPFLSRKTPASLLADKEARLNEQLAAARRKRSSSAAAAREEVSEEASGTLWRNSAEELVGNFVRLAARTVHAVETHLAVRATFPSAPAPRFTRQTLERGQQWVVAKCRVEQTEELTMLFRNLVHQWFWPLGAETHRFRNKRENKADALTVLADELGVELSQHIYDRSLVRLSSIAADPSGLFWSALFAALFAFTVQQRVRMNWLQHYFFTDLASARQRMHASHYLGADKRPLVLYCCRRYLVYHANGFLDCNGLLHAVLTWLFLVQTAFRCELENTEDMREICNLFLDPLSVVAPAG